MLEERISDIHHRLLEMLRTRHAIRAVLHVRSEWAVR